MRSRASRLLWETADRDLLENIASVLGVPACLRRLGLVGVQFDDLPEWEFTTREVGRYEFEVVAARSGGTTGSERTHDPGTALVRLRQWAALVDRESATAELWLLADLLWAETIRPESLPSLATRLLVAGLDTPAVRELAGLDLQPFSVHDARDLFAEVVSGSQMPRRDRKTRLGRVEHVLSMTWSTGRLSTPAVLGRFYRLAVSLDYPDSAELMRLYSLHDEWNAGWGRTNEKIEAEVADLMAMLRMANLEVPDGVLDAVTGTG